MKSIGRDKIEEKKMKAFIAALAGVLVIMGVAWVGLGQLDFSSEKAGQSPTADVRVE